MILTVSPNVALDRVHVVRGYEPGRQSRVLSHFLQPGGSGVHAADVIRALGGQALALGLLGGYTGEAWKAEARRRGLPFDMVPVEGETRESFCLIDLDLGNLVESVEPGPALDASSLKPLLDHLEHTLPRAQLLVISGSLPPGLPADSTVRMIRMAHERGVPTIADLHGEHLRAALGYGVWLVKPSLGEFEELVGHAMPDMAQRVRECRSLQRQSGATIALSMSEDGLLLTGPDEQYWLRPPEEPVHLPGGQGRNVIGCGDALVGALAHEWVRTGDLRQAARLGVAAAHYNLGTLGVPEIDAEPVRRLAGSVQIESL